MRRMGECNRARRCRQRQSWGGVVEGGVRRLQLLTVTRRVCASYLLAHYPYVVGTFSTVFLLASSLIESV
jgi:hypothetical protein